LPNSSSNQRTQLETGKPDRSALETQRFVVETMERPAFGKSGPHPAVPSVVTPAAPSPSQSQVPPPSPGAPGTAAATPAPKRSRPKSKPAPPPTAAASDVVLKVEPDKTKPEEKKDPLLGMQLGSFKVAKLLGRGGMASVYLAEHPAIGSKVAIKFLHRELAANPQVVQRFSNEALAVNLIGHEHIVRIFDLGKVPPSQHYIVMEYLDGRSLQDLLAEGQLPPETALRLLIQVCSALHAAHEHGVIHRDLKPENIYVLEREGRPFAKILDFGIAKLRDGIHKGPETALGSVMGTPAYMSPEQCSGTDVDGRTDIYALGVIAYQLATGKLPFENQGLAQMLVSQLTRTPPAPRSIAPSVHPDWEEAILKALAKQRDQRFVDARSFGEALQKALSAIRPSRPSSRASALAPGAPPLKPAEPKTSARLPLEVNVGGKRRQSEALELSRGGLFACTAEAAPPLFTRVELSLPRANLPPLVLTGEVVRQVGPTEAKAWGLPAGFGVQFVGLSAEQKAALQQMLSGEAASAPKAANAPTAPKASTSSSAPAEPKKSDPSEPHVTVLLEHYRMRLDGNHYDLLGLPFDTDFAELKETGANLKAELLALRQNRLTREQDARVLAVVKRVEEAVAVLGKPLERVRYDAQWGNFLGVRLCKAAGVALKEIEALHQDYLARRPETADQVAQHLSRAKLARNSGKTEAEAREIEAALAIDPLNFVLHERHQSLVAKIKGH
jgi:serine/threonine-protein kinase